MCEVRATASRWASVGPQVADCLPGPAGHDLYTEYAYDKVHVYAALTVWPTTMARVIRLLWRLDFDVSYPYLDKRGSALRILTSTVEDFWTNVAPGTLPLSFVAEKLEEDKSHTSLSWEMTDLNGSIEWPTGVEVDGVFESPLVRTTDRIAREALKLAEVRVLRRAGVRIFCVERFAPEKKRPALESMAQLVAPQFREGLAKTLGSTEDVAFVYEGTSEDGLGFRAQFGPYAEKNPGMVFLRKWGELVKPLHTNDLFFDIDIFETNFSFAEHSLYRWASTKVAKAASFIEFCAKNVK
jgi:hypothetical protein